ncbi:MAG: ribonuclease HII [Erysipelothrix sp.]|jgi:ribonuclease HII|nr:ribonuclease HII [Erysipelothrix sp.]
MILSKIDLEYWNNNIDIIGIDEVGRGPMAGPCIVVGVVLPRYFDHPLIRDSKTLSHKQREEAYEIINKHAKQVIVKSVSVAMIDELNIYRATQEAMEWVANTSHCFALTDAMPICAPHESFIKGDSRSISIAAASIIAKVVRDDLMMDYHKTYPMYGFDAHKGYGTKQHKAMMEKHGLSPIHRKSFTFKK